MQNVNLSELLANDVTLCEKISGALAGTLRLKSVNAYLRSRYPSNPNFTNEINQVLLINQAREYVGNCMAGGVSGLDMLSALSTAGCNEVVAELCAALARRCPAAPVQARPEIPASVLAMAVNAGKSEKPRIIISNNLDDERPAMAPYLLIAKPKKGEITVLYTDVAIKDVKQGKRALQIVAGLSEYKGASVGLFTIYQSQAAARTEERIKIRDHVTVEEDGGEEDEPTHDLRTIHLASDTESGCKQEKKKRTVIINGVERELGQVTLPNYMVVRLPRGADRETGYEVVITPDAVSVKDHLEIAEALSAEDAGDEYAVYVQVSSNVQESPVVNKKVHANVVSISKNGSGEEPKATRKKSSKGKSDSE